MKKLDPNLVHAETTEYAILHSGQSAKCGCTMTMPHSHLVAGFKCECEKGVPELPKESLT